MASVLRLLLIEDDEGDAVIVEDLLYESETAVEMIWVRTLKEAVAALDRAKPDCVLLDLHLPDAQEFSGLTAVRAAAPESAIVVLTGMAETHSGLAAVAAGAQDYLVKGRLDPQWLGRAIQYAVQRKQVETAAAQLQASLLRAEEQARLERGLLPRPRVDTDTVSVEPRYRPGREFAALGGDFYDVVQTADGAVHAVIGDVSGHGATEAALGVCLRVAWRSLVLAGLTGVRLVELLEELLVTERENADTFVTLVQVTLPPDRATARTVRAGHHGLLLRDPVGGVSYVQTKGGLALGLFPGEGDWVEDVVALSDGCRLVLFTDGLFEGLISPGDRRLDLDGLLTLARAHGHRQEFIDALIEGAEAASAGYGGLEDDVAVIEIGWRG
ncbi:fused response regulator/phosphatase [Actinocorallia longicatena]|uniref:SpoIIE family protein phosphatase n=1 Tax=Actinocorallia longicatena TaxID=111803 RepID=A0ABP6Q2C3_9ACTN